ncbi:hypothetical protein HUB92_00525 [Wolbachia endosymbiont of Wiebesia pumilae]|jgi:hypothetical protein|uniref:hypothetical protein n=1 Tax=Wolbachia endosymbiont of Wiebesia pumilae TaxID=2742717 RepID=UPI001AE2AE24|nr:hypothetical protein [Wolbachia endosymbiont of Wiebesia pumilae]QTP61488.1 hypothetical protein HUB92_00525 [Wolbachia endosymbiont of Wiebesia pumilae]
MVELTDAQEEILGSLRQAVWNGSVQEVQNVLDDNEHNDIQAVLSHEGTLTSDKGTILDFVMCCSITIKAQVKIIELIWQKADQKTHDFLCDYKVIEFFEGQPYFADTIDDLKRFQGKIDYNSTEYFALARVIQEIEKHERVKDLDSNLQEAIENLDIDQVKAALENCGEDVERVLEREVYWSSGRVDALLVYPLKVEYSEELNQEDVEKIKESFKLMFDAASPGLLGFEPNGNNYVMDKLTCAQKRFAKIPGVGEQCFQDLIQEFEEKLSKNELDNAKINDQIAWDKEYATRFSQEINQDPSENDDLNFIDDTDLDQNTVNSAPTADNKTPEKNETTFWSEHKGKIALGVVGLCAVGTVAAYVLAYPVVALALTVLAAVILMGAGIAKVLEDPSVERTFTEVQR